MFMFVFFIFISVVLGAFVRLFSHFYMFVRITISLRGHIQIDME